MVQPKVLTESERTARAWQQLLSVTEQRLDELPLDPFTADLLPLS